MTDMLAWDGIPKVEEEIEIQRPIISGESVKDTESDASSDLFEIECLSCSANPVVGYPRHTTTTTIDGGADSSCVSPTTCYALSEASVAWSVVTASAADFSVFSGSEEEASTITTSASCKILPPKPKKPTTPTSELQHTHYGGISSGCKSQKAVRVAGDVYTKTPRITRLDSFTKMMKMQMDANKNVGFGSKYRKDLLYIK